MRCFVLPLLLALALPLTVAQNATATEEGPFYTASKVAYPIPEYLPMTYHSLPDIISFNASTDVALKITLNIAPSDTTGFFVDSEDPSFVQASLFCDPSPGEQADIRFVSAWPGRYQEIVISALTVKAFNMTGVRCSALVPNYIQKPVMLRFEAYELPNVTALQEGQQAAAKAIYDQCCGEKGTCLAWDEATSAAGLNPDAGEVATDLCNVDNNVCDGSGNLISLNLNNYGLSCDFAALDFTNFTALTYVALLKNNLTGDFEAGVKKMATALPGLASLSVGINPALGGELDSSPEGGLCYMIDNGLEFLGIFSTGIGGKLPPCLFGPEGDLIELEASKSNISGSIPETFSTAPSLAVLGLDYTKIDGSLPALPAAMVKLNVSMNALSGPVPAISNNVTSVDLSNNQFTGPLPDSFANHPTLRLLDIRANEISGLPAAWMADTDTAPIMINPPALDTLLLGDNPLKTTFPLGLFFYPNLTLLDIARGELSGIFPKVPKNGFPALDIVDVSENQLEGYISNTWRNTFIFSDENPSYVIVTTSGVGLLPHLFSVANNSLTGDIPKFMAAPQADVTIELYGNVFDNGCDPIFAAFDTCVEGAGTGTGDNGEEGGDVTGTGTGDETTSDDDGGGGLSGGAIAGIVIAVLLVAGLVGFVVYKRRQRGSRNAFQRFEDDGGLEMGQPPNGFSSGNNPYNPHLQP